jgi:hypothetical protein
MKNCEFADRMGRIAPKIRRFMSAFLQVATGGR